MDKLDAIIKQQLTLYSKVHALEAEIKGLKAIKGLNDRVTVLETARKEQQRINGKLLSKKEVKPVEDIRSWRDLFKW